jgi:hypothetical protein
VTCPKGFDPDLYRRGFKYNWYDRIDFLMIALRIHHGQATVVPAQCVPCKFSTLTYMSRTSTQFNPLTSRLSELTTMHNAVPVVCAALHLQYAV